MVTNRAGMIQSLSVHYRYRRQLIRIDTVIMLYRYRWLWQPHKQRLFRNQNYMYLLHTWLSYITIRLKILAYWVWSSLCWTNNMWIKVWYTLHRSFCFSTSIFFIQFIDQPKTFTLFLKSKILDFETLSQLHFIVSNTYGIGKARIEYVSIRLLTVSSQP